MILALDDACCASLPAAKLAALAAVRARVDVVVLARDDRCWVWWPAGDMEVLYRVLAVPGVELYVRRDGFWHRCGRRLPSFDVPDGTAARPLSHVLLPGRVQPEFAAPRDWEPFSLTLVRDERPRGATGMRCRLDELAHWAETATTAQLSCVRGARCGTEVMLLGPRLPARVRGERFWGGSLLLPLGFRSEPALREGALCAALGIGAGDIGVLSRMGLEILARDNFQPLTRVGIRLARQEAV